MALQPVPRGSTGLIHPITGSYVLIDEDGNIRLGTSEFSDVMFIKGTTGELFINTNKVHFIANNIEWNDLVFNKSAVNPTQPAFNAKPDVVLHKELELYG